MDNMSVNLVPRDQTQFAAALSTLAVNFSLQDEVVAKLKSEGLQDLEELRFFFDSEDYVGRWVSWGWGMQPWFRLPEFAEHGQR